MPDDEKVLVIETRKNADNQYYISLKIGHQSFDFNYITENLSEADWYAEQLEKALYRTLCSYENTCKNLLAHIFDLMQHHIRNAENGYIVHRSLSRK